MVSYNSREKLLNFATKFSSTNSLRAEFDLDLSTLDENTRQLVVQVAKIASTFGSGQFSRVEQNVNRETRTVKNAKGEDITHPGPSDKLRPFLDRVSSTPNDMDAGSTPNPTADNRDPSIGA